MADDSNPALDPRSDPDLEVVREKPRVGRPWKRRCVKKKARVSPGTANIETLDSNTNIHLNEGFVGNLSETLDEKGIGSMRDLNFNSNRDIEMKTGFDLNSSGFDLNLNDTYCSNDSLNDNGISCGGENAKKRGCIDLNLDATCHLDDSINLKCETQGKECGFDLNLRLDEEIEKDAIDGNCGWQVEVRESTTYSEILQETPLMEQNDVKEDVSTKELKKDHLGLDSIEGIVEKGVLVDVDVVQADDSRGVGFEGAPVHGTTVNDGCQVDIGSAFKQAGGRRKRMKLAKDLDSSIEMVLRRSARRGSSKNTASSTPPPATCVVNGLATSPSVSAVT